MRFAIRFSIASALATLLAGTSMAQFPPPGPPGPPINPPTVSPYLNLARPGSSAAINYYGLVRPQLAFQNAIGGLQQQLTNTQLGLNQFADSGTGLPVTGHVAVFMNTGGYFMSNGIGPRQTGLGTRGTLGIQGRPTSSQAQQYTPPSSRGMTGGSGGYGR